MSIFNKYYNLIAQHKGCGREYRGEEGELSERKCPIDGFNMRLHKFEIEEEVFGPSPGQYSKTFFHNIYECPVCEFDYEDSKHEGTPEGTPEFEKRVEEHINRLVEALKEIDEKKEKLEGILAKSNKI